MVTNSFSAALFERTFTWVVGLLILELLVAKMALAAHDASGSRQTSLTFLDLAALGLYKYVHLAFVVLVGISIHGALYWLIFSYFAGCAFLSVFKQMLHAPPFIAPQSQQPGQYAPPIPDVSMVQKQVLLALGLVQVAIVYFMSSAGAAAPVSGSAVPGSPLDMR